MDKENLFYLVRKGTNVRATYELSKVLIVTEKVADDLLVTTYLVHEKISIASYEEKFGIGTKCEPIDIPDTVVPTIYTEAENLDDITERQVGVNTHIYNNDVEIAVLSGIHEDLWRQPNYPERKLDFTNQIKHGRIYATVVITEPKKRV